jgi:hypothetical protein
MVRADTIRYSVNRGKAARVLVFTCRYRTSATEINASAWRCVFETCWGRG